MEQISNMGSLQERIQQKLEAERKEKEELTAAELKKLSESLKKHVENELNTIESVIKGHSETINNELKQQEKQRGRRTMWHLLTVLLICLVIFGSTWGLMQFLSFRITSQLQQIEELKQQRVEMEKTVDRLAAQGGAMKLTRCGEDKRLCVKLNERAGRFGEKKELWMIPEGY